MSESGGQMTPGGDNRDFVECCSLRLVVQRSTETDVSDHGDNTPVFVAVPSNIAFP